MIIRLASAVFTILISTGAQAQSHPEAVRIAASTIHEHYENFQIVDFCAKSGIKTRSRTSDEDIVDGIRRLETLSALEVGELERNWGDTRDRTMERIQSEPEEEIDRLCTAASDRLAHVATIASMLENYDSDPLGDQSPDAERPF